MIQRAEFVGRVLSRASRRYGLSLTEAWLDDLIKDQLVPEAIRQGNDGLRPSYSYDRLSYRRALQIARLRRDGFTRRDAIRIQLFLKGYSMPAGAIRSALLTEYVRHSKSLLSQIRSRYLDNFKPLPEKQKERLEQSLGPIDTRFSAADLTLDADIKIELLRQAMQTPINLENGPLRLTAFMESFSNKLAFSTLATQMSSSLAGLLMLDPVQESEPAKPDYLEAIILQSDRRQYELARELYRLVTSRWFVHVADLIATDADPETQRAAFETGSRAVKKDPRWAALILVLGLVFVTQSNMSAAVNEIGERLRSAKEQGLNLWDLVRAEISRQN